ncbi:MAG: restriction endonuclease subunit S [Nautiliaceae bacterium]
MIEEFLSVLGFKDLKKDYNGYTIKIDLKKGKIYYRDDNKTTQERIKDGKIQIGDTTSSHFNPKGDANQEAFVVLYAIDRLLSLGYKPEDLFIERKWKLGRSSKSGKADITIYKNDKAYIIIECKRYDEFEKEKKRMLKNGGQLFSYLNQDTNVKYLALFTSRFEEGDVFYENAIVKIIDNEEKVKECKEKGGELCSYKDAHNVDEFFYIWKNLYDSYFYRYGIFEEDATPYNVELKPLKKRDLIPFKNSKGLFNKFAEILRHNNISDNANAFNKMLSLILCKIVDEEKQDNEVLDFQVIEGMSDEKLVDRLQALYKRGVEKYLGIKDFVYHSDEEIEERIKLFPNRTPLEEIMKFFKEIKYYTDKTFAFKEIYNKKLFEENALILKEVIEMLQHYRFKNSSKNQFLGDFFELLLNHGVKQSEGQFFTPLPIVRFMVLSIDLDTLQKDKEKLNPDSPLIKTLDFACGAGHFLIEAIDEIEKINQQKFHFDINEWTKEYIYGIEKDYRLARTAKIACFLNGDGEANVIYGDGLKKHKELKEDEEKFDLILTNPPYSVKEFKNYVEIEKNEFELFNFLSEKASEIEVLFIERAKQALRNNGRCAIILPSSILTNTGIYTKARELILKYFEIIAITELGSKTFIATGTNTVILFLRRREDYLSADLKRVSKEVFRDEFFENDYIDSKKLFEKYKNFRSLDLDSLTKNRLSKELRSSEIIKSYYKKFVNLSEIKNLKKRKDFKNLGKLSQIKLIYKKFIEFVKEKESEKFYYFLLTHNQKVVIVKSPTDTKKQKEFLGYEFNKKRGFEGIEIYTDEDGKPTTKLYDEIDNPKKANYYVKYAFRKKFKKIEVDFVSYKNLANMLDFDSVEFEKVINTSLMENGQWEIENYKWSLEKLEKIAEIKKGSSITEKDTKKGDIPVVAGGIKEAYYHNIANRPKNIITISASGANAGYVNFWDREIFASDCITLYNRNYFTTKFLFYFLKNHQEDIFRLARGQAQPHVYQKDLKNLKIPLPPLEIQEKIVKEIEEVEEKSEKLKKENEELKKEIEKIINECDNYSKENLKNLCNINMGQSPKSEFYNEKGKGLPFYQGKKDFGEIYLKNPTTWVTNPIKISTKNDILISVRAPVGAVNINPFEKICIGRELAAITPKNINYKLLFYILKFSNIKGKQGVTFDSINKNQLKNLKIPLPPLEIQKEIISKIEKLEEVIENNKKELEKLNYLKIEILEKYLK